MKKSFIILFTVLLLLCSCQSPAHSSSSTPLPEYKIASSSTRTYIKDVICSYSILISPDSTDEELMSVAQFLLDDGYDLHRFLFFKREDELKGPYTVAIINEGDDGTLTLKRDGGAVGYDEIYPPSSPSPEFPFHP